jgi:hypothetical protein
MFDYVKVTFPNTTLQPQTIYSAVLKQNRYQHEMAILQFRDWDTQYNVISSGSPVHIKFFGTFASRDFYGYVHHVNPTKTPGKNFSEVVVIGASMVMKAPSQKVWVNKTADQVIKEIAAKHGFLAVTVPHPRVYPQISQTGHTDWEFMVRLAKQSGYSLRAENTEIYFQPHLDEYTKYRSQAPKFIQRPQEHVDGSTLYSFHPTIGESLNFEDGTFKSAVAVSGVDRYATTRVSSTQQKRNNSTRLTSQVEFFDRYDTHVVAPDPITAKHEAIAADDNNTFAYRATAVVLGEPDLRPDMPVYLDGIGGEHSGYWTILGTEHSIMETERNIQTYTTTLHLGADSLGSAKTWVDNQNVKQPDYAPKRTIIPNVRQTNYIPQSTLITTSVHPSPQVNGSFGTLKNRAKPTIRGTQISPPVWKNKSAGITNNFVETPKPPAVVNRLRVVESGNNR